MVSPRRTGRRAALTKKRVAAARNAESMAVRYHQGPGAADGPLGQILRIGEDQPRSRPIRAMRRTPLRSRVRENGGGAAKSAAPKKVATERADRAAEEETTTRATGTTIRAAITVAAAAPTNRTAAGIVDGSRRDPGRSPDRDRGRSPRRATGRVLDQARALVHGRGLAPSLAADVIAIVMEELHSATASTERDTPPAIATATTAGAEAGAGAGAEAGAGAGAGAGADVGVQGG